MNQDLMVFINKLPKTIKNGAYVINLDEYTDTGTHWIALYSKYTEVIHFDSFGAEYIPKEIKKLIKKQRHPNKHF